ncbi:MAG TPA: DUF3147 family protein [Candidatus Omnitrophica bacterium]|nr:DUF3147 family protein [Candidatus Omnitrophota bacterium]
MQFLAKLFITISIIIVCARIGKQFPTLAGLIATMPLTGLIILIWLYSDNPGNFNLMKDYTRGALWGIIPSALFFISAYFLFRREISIGFVIGISFAIWLIAAFIHQWFLR